jgi:hypothetical protein
MSQLSPGAIQIAKTVAPRLQEVFDTYIIVGLATNPQTGEVTRQVLFDTSCQDEAKLADMKKMATVSKVWASGNL